jgi:hypothetical protein
VCFILHNANHLLSFSYRDLENQYRIITAEDDDDPQEGSSTNARR